MTLLPLTTDRRRRAAPVSRRWDIARDSRLSTLDSRLSTLNSPRGFTLIELLVVIAIVALLASMALVVYGRVGENARIAGTKTLLRQLDAVIKERMESLRRYNFESLALSRYRLSTYEIVAYTTKSVYREEFPQRFEDLYGADGDSGDGHHVNGSSPMADPLKAADNAPLWGLIKRRLSMVSSQDLATFTAGTPNDHYISNGELLYLALTEGSSYGLPPLDISQINGRYVVDKDNDSFSEFVDGWEQPLRFYNFPTALLRPVGNVYDKSDPMGVGQPITVADYRRATYLIRALPPLPIDPMTNQVRDLRFNEFDHPLNIDPHDPLGTLTVDKTPGTVRENRFDLEWHAMDTFWVPLVVAAGPDQKLGMFEPAMVTPSGTTETPEPNLRNIRGKINTAAIDDLYDNLTNYQRGGF